MWFSGFRHRTSMYGHYGSCCNIINLLCLLCMCVYVCVHHAKRTIGQKDCAWEEHGRYINAQAFSFVKCCQYRAAIKSASRLFRTWLGYIWPTNPCTGLIIPYVDFCNTNVDVFLCYRPEVFWLQRRDCIGFPWKQLHLLSQQSLCVQHKVSNKKKP